MAQVAEATGEFRGTTVRDDATLAAWLSKHTEPALEPDLPIIDPHHHFWDGTARGSYLLPDLLSDVGGGHNIVSTVFLECRAMYRKSGPRELAAVGEVEFVNGIAAMSASGNYGNCRVAEAIIGGGDLTVGARVRELLEAEIAAAGGRLRGLRHGVAWDKHESVQKYASRVVAEHQVMDPKFREGMAQLAPLGLSFESWQYQPQLPDAIDLARAFPNTTIILNHVGGILGVGPYAGHRAEILTEWRNNIVKLAKCPNVNMKLGGLGMVRSATTSINATCRPRLRTSPPRGVPISNIASKPSASTVACSRAIFRLTNNPADIPNCGTPSSGSPPPPPPQKRRRCTAAPRRTCIGSPRHEPVRRLRNQVLVHPHAPGARHPGNALPHRQRPAALGPCPARRAA
jgi:predicted TIM-barrel fold metal-dependent hydrolase